MVAFSKIYQLYIILNLFQDDYQNKGNLTNKNTVNVLLEIQDNQDTPPLFLDTPITIFVIENLPVVSIITLRSTRHTSNNLFIHTLFIFVKGKFFRLSVIGV